MHNFAKRITLKRLQFFQRLKWYKVNNHKQCNNIDHHTNPNLNQIKTIRVPLYHNWAFFPTPKINPFESMNEALLLHWFKYVWNKNAFFDDPNDPEQLTEQLNVQLRLWLSGDAYELVPNARKCKILFLLKLQWFD